MAEVLYWHVRRPLERLKLSFVWALPRWLVYWCAMRVLANATTGRYGNEFPSEVTALEALDRWREPAA